MNLENKKWTALVAVLSLSVAGWALAQDEVAAPDAAADESTVQEEPAADAAEQPARKIKPRPSEIMPLASKSLMLGIANSGKVLVAVGERGNIVVSKDGRNWAQVQAPSRAALTAVSFADDKHGWAVGHDAAILATVDGGRSWSLQNFEPDLEKPFLAVLALDAQRAIAVGAYGLLKQTSDGGKTWEEAEAPSIRGDELHFNSIVTLNDGSLFIAGEQGMLGHSKDGGATWSKLPSPYEASLFGALPVGSKGALIYGLRGNAYVSQDVAAGNWTRIQTDTVASFFGGTALPDGRLALVGLNGTLLLVDAGGGSVKPVSVTTQETGKNGQVQVNILSSTLSAAIPFGSSLIVVGEQGVREVASVK